MKGCGRTGLQLYETLYLRTAFTAMHNGIQNARTALQPPRRFLSTCTIMATSHYATLTHQRSTA
jgi:hypothetical protein